MAFKDVLGFLYERAKQRYGIKNQDDFARRHGMSREHMNQLLTGNVTPPPKTVWLILEVEGYALADCVDLPDARSARAKRPDLFAHLETIVMSDDDTRIHGISINLHDIAAGVRTGKKYEPRISGSITETRGNIAPLEKKRNRKPPRAS